MQRIKIIHAVPLVVRIKVGITVEKLARFELAKRRKVLVVLLLLPPLFVLASSCPVAEWADRGGAPAAVAAIRCGPGTIIIVEDAEDADSMVVVACAPSSGGRGVTTAMAASWSKDGESLDEEIDGDEEADAGSCANPAC